MASSHANANAARNGSSNGTFNGPFNGSANGPAVGFRYSSSTHTVTAVSRWSILNKQLPAADKIKAIHVYDFDNTLFKTPLPNPNLWNGPSIGTLANQDAFVNGGWWHDSRILAATGEGRLKEELRGWDGWWNEKIVELIHLSAKQKDALSVLLTGRSESGFSELIKSMVTSKGLDFDMISLKPAVGPSNQRFASTMIFKQMFLEALMETYKFAEEIRIYEDRPKHVKGFRDFMTDYNKKQNGIGGTPTRSPITAEVVQVADMATNLDPVVEVAEVQHLINSHNEAVTRRPHGIRGERLVIKKTVFYTGYLIDKKDTQRLLTLANLPPSLLETELKFHANNIMICPRPCPPSILEKVGGMGSKMMWEVTGTACFENSIWAACLRPVPPTAKFHTDNPNPLVVLALRKGARPVDAGKIQNWQPVPPDKAYVFETTVGEKVLLRIEPEDPRENAYESLFPSRTSRKRQPGDENHIPTRPSAHYGGGHGGGNNKHSGRSFHHQANYMARGGSNQGGRGGYRSGAGGNAAASRGYRANNPRGGGGGALRGGRGGRGGGGHGYRSLDDVGGYAQPVAYDDDPRNYPPPQAPKGPKDLHGQQHQQQQQAHPQPQLPPQNLTQFYQAPYHQQPPPPQPQQVQQPPLLSTWPVQGGVPTGPSRPIGGGAPGYATGPDLREFY